MTADVEDPVALGFVVSPPPVEEPVLVIQKLMSGVSAKAGTASMESSPAPSRRPISPNPTVLFRVITRVKVWVRIKAP